MALPPQIQTVTVSFGPFVDFQGIPLAGSTRFTPSTPVNHAATGTPILNRPINVVWNEDGRGVLVLPATDSVGLDVTGFTYRVQHTFSDGSVPAPPSTSIQLPAAVPTVDLDLLIPVPAQNGVVVSVPGVVSVAGKSGVVTGADLAAVPEVRAAFLPRWTPNTAYALNELALSPTGQVIQAVAAFTSGATYSASNWTVVAGGGASYTDEQAQDAVAAMFASGTMAGVSFVYDDATGKMNVTVTGSGQLDAWDIRAFVQSGETLVSDNTGTGNNTPIIQRAVDAANAAYLVDGRCRQIIFPDGTYRLAQAGSSNGANYGVVWKSGAGIKTRSMRGVRFMCPPTATAFFAAEQIAGIADCVFDPHVVDGALQTNATYTSKFKGWFVQGMNRCFFNEVVVQNTFSTGFGCDYLRGGTVVTGEARNCGRGIKELGVDPLTTSGGSGFGIGTGRYVVEDYTLDVRAYDCGFHGVFTETQGSEPNGLTKGSRIRAYCQGNFVGFRDCGSDGLVADIMSRGSTYAEILHDQTVLNSVSGTNGRMRVDLADGKGAGIVIGAADDGPYTIIGEIRGMAGKGVTTKSGAAIAPRLTLDLNVHHCGGDAVDLPVSTTDLRLSVRAWLNTGLGLRLGGAGTATDLTLAGCDFRSGGYTITQALAGETIVSASRGIGLSGPSNLTVVPGSASGSVRATWTAPVLDAASVTDYQVEYRLAGSTGPWTVFAHTASTSATIAITGLTASTSYEVRVAALRGATLSSYTTTATGQSAGAGATGVVASDDFNRTDNTSTLGTAVLGGTWQYVDGGTPFRIASNQATRSGVAGGSGFAWLPVTIADGSVSAVIATGSIAATGLLFRYVDANNYLWADASSASNGIRLFARVNGANVALGTATGFAYGSTLTLSGVGTALRVLVDGAEKLAGVAPAGAPTSGFPGLRTASSTSGPSTYDAFSASVA